MRVGGLGVWTESLEQRKSISGGGAVSRSGPWTALEEGPPQPGAPSPHQPPTPISAAAVQKSTTILTDSRTHLGRRLRAERREQLCRQREAGGGPSRTPDGLSPAANPPLRADADGGPRGPHSEPLLESRGKESGEATDGRYLSQTKKHLTFVPMRRGLHRSRNKPGGGGFPSGRPDIPAGHPLVINGAIAFFRRKGKAKTFLSI